MSDEPTPDPSHDNSNRATVAQTLAEVRGLRDLMRAEFAATQRQLDAVSSLPVTVAKLQAQNADQEGRIAVIEASIERRGEWRRIHLPTIIFSGVIAAAAIVTLALQLH